mgnify:FL=1|jgi:hypothetical protein
MSDIQAIASDLTRLADALARGATELEAAAPAEHHLSISSGSSDLDQAFADALYGCRVARDAIRTDLDDTAANLRAVRDEFERNEWRARQLFDEVMKVDPLADR